MEGKAGLEMNSICTVALKAKAAALYDMTARLKLGTPSDVFDDQTWNNFQIQARMHGLIINAPKLRCKVSHHHCLLFLSHITLYIGGSRQFSGSTILLFRP